MLAFKQLCLHSACRSAGHEHKFNAAAARKIIARFAQTIAAAESVARKRNIAEAIFTYLRCFIATIDIDA